jgi:hypothetical protein
VLESNHYCDWSLGAEETYSWNSHDSIFNGNTLVLSTCQYVETDKFGLELVFFSNFFENGLQFLAPEASFMLKTQNSQMWRLKYLLVPITCTHFSLKNRSEYSTG